MADQAEAGGDQRLEQAQRLYLDLLIRSMTRMTTGPGHRRILPRSRLRARVYAPVDRALAKVGVALMRPAADDERKQEGISFIHADADSSMGVRRLQFLQRSLTDVHLEGIAGDLVELGCWRGGGAIFMRGFLAVVGDADRTVWAADSFLGYPPPGARAGEFDHILHGNTLFKVTLDEVKGRFERYGLLDERVRFLDGYFSQTLPGAAIEQVALVHIDVSTYDGTMDALRNIYPKISAGGFLFLGDYGADGSRRAADEFRAEHGIDTPLQIVPQQNAIGRYWRKEG